MFSRAESAEADRRHVRRLSSPDEAARIVQAAQTGPEAGNLTGPDRAILYALALGTGFRAKELGTLTPERFNLDSDTPTVVGKSCYTKNGKEAVQPLSASLAARMRPWLATKAQGRPVFEGMTQRTAEMLLVDLKAVKIPYETDSGVVDFHSLRGDFISYLVSSGASVKT
jgi:integrase